MTTASGLAQVTDRGKFERVAIQALIAKHWEHLQYSPLFIQAALFVGTPRCLALADARIRECPSQINVLEHVDDHFGIMVGGRQDSVTLAHLERLLPYVDRLDDISVWMIAEFCNRRGHQEWVRQHLMPYLAEGHRADVCPTEADIERELDRSAGDDGRSIWLRHWAEEGAGRLVPPGQLIGILRRWIGGRDDLKAWQVAAEIIAAIGTRSDLDLLESWPPTHSDEGSPDYQEHPVSRRAPEPAVIDLERGAKMRTSRVPSRHHVPLLAPATLRRSDDTWRTPALASGSRAVPGRPLGGRDVGRGPRAESRGCPRGRSRRVTMRRRGMAPTSRVSGS